MKTIFLFSMIFLSGTLRAQQLPGFSSQGNAGSVCEGLAFNSDEEAFKKVKDICDAMDIAGNFMVSECGNVDNCKAVLNSSGSYIFYNKSYLQKIKGLNFTEASFKSAKNEDWDVLCILAHEIGHHVLQHLANFQQLSRMMPLVDMELQADKFAGACMYRLGASLEQAQHVMHDPSISEKASMNHPARTERLDAIALGYNKAKAKSTNTVVVSNAAPEVEKKSDAVTDWSTGKYDKAVKEFEKHVEDPKYAAYLGYAYAYGLGVPVDYKKAIDYFKKAADKGYAEAQFSLGYLYASGTGVPLDYTTGFNYYKLAAEQGLASAQLNLGHLYFYGYGVELNYAKALENFQKCADQQEPYGLYSLALMYYYGTGVEKSHTKALEYVKKSANLNCAEAQYWLGYMYEAGEGTGKDQQEANNWYKLAAKQNYVEAQEACKRLNIDWQ